MLQPHARTVERARNDLAARLHARRPELEQALATRVHAISDPRDVADPIYLEGLRNSVRTALDYALATLSVGEQRAPEVPTSLLAQARLAARHGIGLDTVLRRYFAGYGLFTDFLVREVEEGGLFESAALQQLLCGQTAVFDSLIAAVSDEHGRELTSRATTAEQRRRERIERLLAGELVETAELDYDLNAHHLGLLARGVDAAELIDALGRRLDRRLLMVRRDEETVWGWLGGRRRIDPQELRILTDGPIRAGVHISLGEPAEGLTGWRLTHRQAAAALPIAIRGPDPIVRYLDVGLIASLFLDDLFRDSFRDLYLNRLADNRDQDAVVRETLRAYFEADRSITSAAAKLGVNRRTVEKRLRAVEHRLGAPLARCGTDLEVSLRLDKIDGYALGALAD